MDATDAASPTVKVLPMLSASVERSRTWSCGSSEICDEESLGPEDSAALGEVETSLLGVETALVVSVATGLGSVSVERRTRLRALVFESEVGLGASVVTGGTTG